MIYESGRRTNWASPLSAFTVTTQGYFALGIAALIGTFSGFLLSFYIIKRFSATASAMTAYVIPLV